MSVQKNAEESGTVRIKKAQSISCLLYAKSKNRNQIVSKNYHPYVNISLLPRKLLESKSSTDMFSVTVSVVVSGNSHFDATLVMACDSMMLLDTDDDTILSAFVLKQVDMREDPQHPRAIIVEHSVTGADTISEVSSFAELSPSNIGPSRDVTNRSSRQSFSENEAVNLTLFMDPVYLRPLLSRFKLFKSGY